MKEAKLKYVLLLPAVVLLVGLSIFPTAYTFMVSFTKYNFAESPTPQEFVGYKNYLKAFSDKRVPHATWITVLIVGGSLILELVAGLCIAPLISKAGKLQAIAKGVFVLTFMLPEVLTGLSWRFMLTSEMGVFDYWTRMITRSFGLNFTGFLADRNLAVFSIIMVDVWQWAPLVALIIAAGLASMPAEPIEAARVDGASGWQILRYVTLPMLKHLIAITILLRAVTAVKMFDKVASLTGSGPGYSTEVISYYIYVVGLRFFKMGYASALTIVLTTGIGMLFGYYASKFVFPKLGRGERV